MPQVRIGALCWNQYTEWTALLEAGIRADALGYDTLWTWDHVYPIVGDSRGPNF
jgi:alkanesulfonate monooxygenase SsuD/methylene tetrahydromethanopterin reductase-like flavin-dependent oxidoreductase (luciferase family)